jgi:hypothetical protein
MKTHFILTYTLISPNPQNFIHYVSCQLDKNYEMRSYRANITMRVWVILQVTYIICTHVHAHSSIIECLTSDAIYCWILMMLMLPDISIILSQISVG